MDSQSRRDAMADAATLLLAVATEIPLVWSRTHQRKEQSCEAFAYTRPGLNGSVVVSDWKHGYYSDRQRTLAIEAARAAFRAVPGLRGDKGESK